MLIWSFISFFIDFISRKFPNSLELLVYVLQTQDLRVDQKKEPCIRVNIRELDRELYTR